jgi:hypothetical protein
LARPQKLSAEARRGVHLTAFDELNPAMYISNAVRARLRSNDQYNVKHPN